jgi:hypothetical protein
MPLVPTSHRWYDAVLLAVVVIVAAVGLVGMASHPAPSTSISIGTITGILRPEGMLPPAPNGTASIAGSCRNSTMWTDIGSPNNAAGPPFTTGETLSCFFFFPDSSMVHSGPNHSLYVLNVTLAEVSPPFVFIGEIPALQSCPPTGCDSYWVGLEFQLPSQPGTYNAVFVLLYTWVYIIPPS